MRDCPICGLPAAATYEIENKQVAECYNHHVFKVHFKALKIKVPKIETAKMKIEAAQRLKATSESKVVEQFLSKLGIDAELVHVAKGSASYELYTDTAEVLSIFTKKLGKSKEGHKGTTKLYVWDIWNPEIGLMLSVPPEEGATLEVYDL